MYIQTIYMYSVYVQVYSTCTVHVYAVYTCMYVCMYAFCMLKK